jgi:Domain of Unknown Function (DUF1540)
MATLNFFFLHFLQNIFVHENKILTQTKDVSLIKEEDTLAKDVLCEVRNCQFWEEGNRCSADQIYVVSHVGDVAEHQRETDCKTFKPK